MPRPITVSTLSQTARPARVQVISCLDCSTTLHTGRAADRPAGPLTDVERKHALEGIYWAGDLRLLCLARKGFRRTRVLAQELVSHGIIVVSGLGEGVDVLIEDQDVVGIEVRSSATVTSGFSQGCENLPTPATRESRSAWLSMTTTRSCTSASGC
jgi:hypothetical protein